MFKKKAKKRSGGFLNEFKEFATKGNAIDLAVGVIIGAAFQSIVNSLVKDVIMPIVGWIIGDVDLSSFFIILGKLPETVDTSKIHSLTYVRDTLGVAVFAYGSLMTAILNFVITAFGIFLIVKTINSLKRFSLIKKVDIVSVNTKKICPYCCSEIKINATRCPFCTSVFEKENKQ